MSLFGRLAELLRDPTASPDRASSSGTEPPPDASATAPATTDAVAVVCQQSPSGIRRYDLTVAVDAPDRAVITAVEPELLAAHFEITEGGIGASAARMRAVDFTGEAPKVDAGILLSVRLDRRLPLESVELRIHDAIDHGGTEIADRLRLTALD